MKAFQIAFDGKDIENSLLEKMYKKREREIRLSKKRLVEEKELKFTMVAEDRRKRQCTFSQAHIS